LVLAAPKMALQQCKDHGVIHHSGQGSQHTSLEFGRRCAEMKVLPSMSSHRDAYDNAMAESFFGSLECELLDRRGFKSEAEARTALFTYIEGWDNPRRRHSALGYRSPAQFERRHHENTATPKSCVSPELPTVGARVAGAAPPVDNPADQTAQAPRRPETQAGNRP
jgi:putative transposase